MAITINGTTGIAGVDGSASTPAVQGTDTNTGIFFPAADTIAFGEGGAEVARFDSSGNVGIGTTSPSQKLDVSGNIRSFGTGTPSLIAENTSTGDSYVDFRSNSALQARLYYSSSIFGITAVPAIPMVFKTTDAERARITSGGNFGIGATAPSGKLEIASSATSEYVTKVDQTASSGGGFPLRLAYLSQAPNNTTSRFLTCVDNAADRLYIYSNGNVVNTNNSYGALSDLKLKQDITDASSQWDDIKALRFVRYRLKNEVANNPDFPFYLGVIAQEAEQVSPGLIDESPDFEEVKVTDEEGNVTTERQATGTVTKSVKYSILYMKAVKALQEAQLRIETLEAQNAAFEARLAALEAK